MCSHFLCITETESVTLSFTHSRATEAPIKIPAIGLDLFVRLPPAMSGGEFCFIETINAPGKGPPQHRHREAEIFRVIEGRYLYQVGRTSPAGVD
jgi:quercetin dioxygenase-like cupin family protein